MWTILKNAQIHSIVDFDALLVVFTFIKIFNNTKIYCLKLHD